MTRRSRWLVALGAVLFAAVGAGLWALPELVRRVALDQIPKVTGRAASIEDIDLNLFTGRFAIKKFRMAERQGAEALIELERLDGRLWLPSLLALDIRLPEIRLVAPSVRLIRTGPTEFNFSDLLALVPAPDPAKKPSRWTFTVHQLEIQRGQILVEDRAVSPAADWSLRDLDVTLAGVTTHAERPPGRAEMRAGLGSATIEIRSPAFRLTPVEYKQSVALERFDLTRVGPYVPADIPTVIKAGTLGVELTIEGKRDKSGAQTAAIKGNVTIEKLALSQAGQSAPFLTIPRLALEIGQADPFAREVVLTGLQIEGLDLRSERNRAGKFDILAAWQAWLEGRAARERTAAAPSPAAPAPAAPEWRARIERIAVKDGRVVLTDGAVSPRREWRLEQLVVDAAKLSTSHDDPPGSLQLKTQIASSPGASPPATLMVDLGSVRLLPLLASGRLALTGFDI
jgi:uncharacterized protein involved in outer membrane biogenesis